jgi:NAD(P)-dependent dehydrogenase (short-subunit alcohol dehydrogenase family)
MRTDADRSEEIMSVLQGNVAIITGAKGGLGSFVTEAFLAAGAHVVGVSRSIQASDFAHAQFTAMLAELSSGDAARKVAADVRARFGRIDILAHLMGGFAGGQSVADTDDATFEKMLDLNYRAAFYMVRAVLAHMRAQGSGRIIAVASRQAAEPAAMTGAYSASKAALVSLIKTVALENKYRGISANTVLPATMDTPGNPGPQFVKPAQVAAMIVHLVSDAATQVTGAAIPIYGSQA